jgi:hypothetical protein
MIAPLQPPSCPKCSAALRWKDIRGSFRCGQCQAPLYSNANAIWGWGSVVLALVSFAAFDNMGFWPGLLGALALAVIGGVVISVFITVKQAGADAT